MTGETPIPHDRRDAYPTWLPIDRGAGRSRNDGGVTCITEDGGGMPR